MLVLCHSIDWGNAMRDKRAMSRSTGAIACAMLVACGSGGDGLPDEISSSTYNGTWLLTASDTAGCGNGTTFTVSLTISVSERGEGGGFPMGGSSAWSSSSGSGALGGWLAGQATDGRGSEYIVFMPEDGTEAFAQFDAILDVPQLTMAGTLFASPGSLSSGSADCLYAGKAVKQ